MVFLYQFIISSINKATPTFLSETSPSISGPHVWMLWDKTLKILKSLIVTERVYKSLPVNLSEILTKYLTTAYLRYLP